MSTLDEALSVAVRELFPTVQITSSARFLPMLDLSKGELSSSAAIEIARLLRGDATRIAGDLIKEMSKSIPGTWQGVAGYMVLSGASERILREEVTSLEGLSSINDVQRAIRSIVCLVPDATSPVYARLRLIACSSLQALLAVAFEGQCRLGFEPEAPQIVTSQREVVDLAVRAVERCLSHEGESRLQFSIPNELCSIEAPLIVWTSHHYHDRLPRSVKESFCIHRSAGTAFLKIPPDGWLVSRDRALSELLSADALKQVARRLLTHEAWLRWIYHLASSISSGDLDPSVALYDECASPRWSLQALHQRVAQLLGGMTDMHKLELADLIVSRPLVPRDMLIRALFLPSLTVRAVRDGETLAWSRAVEEFAARAHAILNAPHYRVALKNIPISGGVAQINAGLILGITSILAVVTEG